MAGLQFDWLAFYPIKNLLFFMVVCKAIAKKLYFALTNVESSLLTHLAWLQNDGGG